MTTCLSINNKMLSADFGKMLVVSPHLDDAVLSCGELIDQCRDAVVVTVFAGIPPQADEQTEWDAASGFLTAAQALAWRRDEDRAALALLGARPLWLEFCDSQYRVPPAPGALEQALHNTILALDPENILLPSGLFHSDHLLVHQAMMGLREKHPRKNWFMYEEALYRRIPGLLDGRLADLGAHGIECTPLAFSEGRASGRKRQAVQCYASQLRALQTVRRDGHADAFAPEHYWRLGTPGGLHAGN